jgi:putative protease
LTRLIPHSESLIADPPLSAAPPVRLPELLAPAGNLEKLQTVVNFGADAVYLGGPQYGLRAFADNFSFEEIKIAVRWAHDRGVRVYVTLNILAHPADMNGLPAYVEHLQACGADAVIVSDPGVFMTVRRYAPQLAIHISTQASVTNAESCRFWYEQGARRIVLARELTLSEIASIRREIPADLELEGFVHGAMCMSYSGRCLLSDLATGRGANRGACAQPCRWKYYVIEEKRAADRTAEPYTWEIDQDERGSYFFSSRDLCMIEHIPELIAAGINSFKIEGRMKGAFYGAVVTKQYRAALDRYAAEGPTMQVDPVWKAELEQMVHRTYDTGFYFDSPLADAKIAPERTYHREGVVVGIITGRPDAAGRVRCEQRNKLMRGDELDIIQPKGENLRMTVTTLFDEEALPTEAVAHPRQTFYLQLPAGMTPQPGSFLRRPGQKYGESYEADDN